MSYYGWGWGKRNLELVRDTKKQDDFQGGTYRRDAAGTDGRCGESSIEVRSVPASKYAPQFNQEALYD